MKKSVFFLFILCFLFSCHKDNKDNNGDGIVIKGSIPSNVPAKRSMLSTESSFTMADAKSVLVFSGERYTVSKIENGTFSTSAPMGCAAALIFLNADNHFIGNLFVSGLNMLPLVNLSEKDQTVIDLSNLNLDGTSVLPTKNPIGSDIQITAKDISLYKELGSYFEFLSKNIDTDNDGIPDNFSGKQLMVNTGFNISMGTAGLNNTAPIMTSATQLAVNYVVRITGNNPLVPPTLNISLTGPEGEPYTDIVRDNYEYNTNCSCFTVFFSRRTQIPVDGSNMLPFKKGIYTFTMDGTQKHTISYSSINAKYFLVLAVPTFKTNSDGYVTSVTIDYMLPDKTPAEASKFISTLMLQFHDANMTEIYHEGSIFETTNILPDFKNVTLKTPVKLSSIHDLNISYTDLVGNIYNLFWQKP